MYAFNGSSLWGRTAHRLPLKSSSGDKLTNFTQIMKFDTPVKYLYLQKKGLYLTSQSHVEQLIVCNVVADSTDVCGVVRTCSKLLAISLASHKVDQNTVSFITDISTDRFWCSENFLCISSFSPGFCIFLHCFTEYIHDCQNKYLGRHFISFADDSGTSLYLTG